MNHDPKILCDPFAPPGEGRPLPLALSGLPTRIENKPVHYRRKEIAKVGSFVHRGTGRVVSISRQRMQQWLEAFNKRLAKGLKPFIADLHTENPSAKNTQGYVVGLSVSGDSLYADLQLIGDEALDLVARNDISLYAVANALDHDGERYAECLHHCALTPNAAHPGLGGYMTIAASAGSATAEVPIYERSDPFALSAGLAPARRPHMLQPDQMQKLRQKLSLAADVPDEQVMDVAAEHVAAAIDLQAKAQADAAKVTSLSAEVSNLKRDLTAANEKVTALSADAPKELDPRTLSLMRRTFKADREKAVGSGVISEAGMKQIDELLGVNRPDGIALSLSAGNGEDAEADMVYSRLCEIIAAHPGIKTNAAVQRARAGSMSLSANGNDEPTEERKRELLNQSPLGQAVLTAAK